MAISLSDNLAYSGSQSNFERDSYATLADMKSVKKTKMPNVMTAVCEETGKLYIYNKNNEADEELGLWRELDIGGGAENNKASFPINFINYYHNGKIGEINGDHVDPECYRDYESFDLFALAIKKELSKVKYNLLNAPHAGGKPVEEITSVRRYTGDAYDNEAFMLLADDDFNYKKYLKIEFNNHNAVIIDTEEKSITGFYGSFAIAREEASSCECEEETDTIDFSTWPEFTNPEANGIVLDGQGGANVDNSNVGVDPDDIEPDD
jgi:hypothetical protein